MFPLMTKLGYGLLSVALLLSLSFTTVYAEEPTITRATFTSGIKNREPINHLKTANQSIPKIYFFTEIRNYKGKSITHRWIYDKWVVQQVPFKITSNRWRAYSAKTLLPEKGLTGDWKVEILDANGKVVGEQHFTYVCQGHCPKEEVKQPKKKVKTKKKLKKAIKAKKKSSKKTIKKVTKAKKKSRITAEAKPAKSTDDNSAEATSTPKVTSDIAQVSDTEASETQTSEVKASTDKPSNKNNTAKSSDKAETTEPSENAGQIVQDELRSVIQEAKDDLLFGE